MSPIEIFAVELTKHRDSSGISTTTTALRRSDGSRARVLVNLRRSFGGGLSALFFKELRIAYFGQLAVEFRR